MTDFYSEINTELNNAFGAVDLIGEGSYARVYSCYRNNTEFAVKVVPKKHKVSVATLKNGFKIASLLPPHRNICASFDFIETESFLCFFLEKINGIELFDYCKQNHGQIGDVSVGISTEIAKNIITQLLTGFSLS